MLDSIQEGLEQLGLDGLQQVEKRIEQERKRREKEARKQAQQEIREVAQRYGLGVEDLLAQVDTGKAGKGKGSSKSKGKVPPKFRHPEDPSKTWTGRGRKPKWVQAWEEAGGDLEALRIPEQGAA
ncbi:trans-acting regulatory HvrA protein [Halorhodospira neutriphila]|uniref:Trans-acting regulatory HvrA protein n=1 Tax=Halorhodospira neutriphila TaxID=168379 RepID=A0ABS1E544_9GAMM|nr:trans-acting regulatory HvrA protein [Halorhodospira neutriphila]